MTFDFIDESPDLTKEQRALMLRRFLDSNIRASVVYWAGTEHSNLGWREYLEGTEYPPVKEGAD